MASVFNTLNVAEPSQLNDVNIFAMTMGALRAGAPPGEVFDGLQRFYGSAGRQLPRDIEVALLRGGLTPDTPVDGAACYLHHRLQQPTPPVCGSPSDSGSETSLEGLLRMGPDPSLRTATGGTALHELVSRLVSGRYHVTYSWDDITMLATDSNARRWLYLQRAVPCMVQAGFSLALRDNAGRSVVDILRDAYCSYTRAATEASRVITPYIRMTLEELGMEAPLLGPPGLGPQEQYVCDARMPFGCHATKRLVEVPTGYLEWMCREDTEMWDPAEAKVLLLRDLLLLQRVEAVRRLTLYDMLYGTGGAGGSGGGAGPGAGGGRLAVEVNPFPPDMVPYDNLHAAQAGEGHSDGSGKGSGSGLQERGAGTGQPHGVERGGATGGKGVTAAGSSEATATTAVAAAAAAAAASLLVASSTPPRDAAAADGTTGAPLRDPLSPTQAAAAVGGLLLGATTAGGSGSHCSGLGSPPCITPARSTSWGSPPAAHATLYGLYGPAGVGSKGAGHVLSYSEATQLAMAVCNQPNGSGEAQDGEGDAGQEQELGQGQGQGQQKQQQQPMMPFGAHKGRPLRQVPSNYIAWMCDHQQHPHFFESPMGREVLEVLLATGRVAMGADGRPHVTYHPPTHRPEFQ